MDHRLVAITHGDPTKAEVCGRPLFARLRQEEDAPAIEKVYVCPLHGDIKDQTPYPFFKADARTRRKYDE